MDACIVAESLVVRYRPDLDPVLNGLSFSIKGASLAHRQQSYDSAEGPAYSSTQHAELMTTK